MIELAQVCVELGGRRVLDGVTLRVEPGESVALVGANGSGKTTLLRAVLGLVPFEGRIVVGGVDVAARPVESRRAIAYLPQRGAFGEDTALEALTFVARLRGLDRRRVLDVLDQVGLADHARARVRTFSVGMQQRLLLASTLLCEAPVLLLDEPTASLDAGAQALFEEIVGRWRREGRTILLASHRDTETRRLTDRTLALEDGRLLEAERNRWPAAVAACGRSMTCDPAY